MKIRKFFCLALAVSLTFGSTTFNTVRALDTDSISSKQEAEEQLADIEAKIAEYEQKQKDIEKKLGNIEKDKANYNEIRKSLSEKVDSIKAQMSLVDAEIKKTDQKIENNEMDIYKKRLELNAAKEELKERLHALYITGQNGKLAILLDSEDFGKFLAHAEMLRGVSDHDKKLMDNLLAQVKQVNTMKQANNADKSKNTELKAQLSAKQAQYNKEYNSANAMLSELAGVKTTLYEDSAVVMASLEESRAAASEMREFIQNNSGNFEFGSQKEEPTEPEVVESDDDDDDDNDTPTQKPTEAPPSGVVINPNMVVSSFGFAFPFKNSYYISCPYGYDDDRFHTGVDITCSGALGEPIYAAASGYVIREQWSNVSYGNCLIIDHGKKNGYSYSTLYAHCNTLLVSRNQYVRQGQLIAYCGSTGNSTGPHLHFEVREDGDYVDPFDYIPRP